MRPYSRGATTLAVLLVALAAASSVSAATHHAKTKVKTVTTTVDTRVPGSGNYAVIVTLAAVKTDESVNVSAGSQSQNGIVLYQGAGTDVLAFYPKVKGKTLVVRTVSNVQPAHFSVEATRLSTGSQSKSASEEGPSSPPAKYTGGFNNLVFSDEFNGAAQTPPNPSSWADINGSGCGPGTLSSNSSSPANVSLDGNGALDITALPNESAPGSYTAGEISSYSPSGSPAFMMTYGRIEARIKLAAGQGLCNAFWLAGESSPSQPWPSSGEVDIMEALGQAPSVAVATLHGPTPLSPSDENYQQWESQITSATSLASGYHTYGVIWTANQMTWTLDGLPYATATAASLYPGSQWVFTHPFQIIFDLAVGGWPGAPSATTPFPATMSVAWVRAYQ